MKFTCLSKGNGFHLPPCYVLHVSGFRILLDCPLDLSALSIFSPVPADFCPVLEESSNSPVHDSLITESETEGRCKIEKPLDAKDLIYAEPWYKTVKNLHFWDPSSIDIVLISSAMGMIGLPFLTRNKGFSAKIYATEATARLGQLMMEDLVSMHSEFRNFYGRGESGSPQWMKWEELELLPSPLREVALGKDGAELGRWMPLYSLVDVNECMQKVQTLKYAEAACHNGALVIQAFSSGLEIGSCNWIVESPKGNVTCVSSSLFLSAHAMEFDYHALQGKDLILYSDFSAMTDDIEHHDNDFSPTNNNLSTPSNDEDNWKHMNECLLANDESLEEIEKLTFLCSCVMDSAKAGGSVLIPLNRLGIVLQLLEQISNSLESSALKVPIYVISSIAAELLAFLNIVPEWLCKLRQEKLFSGEPLFSHVELMREKKIHVFPALHSPNLITNWQEPCIIFAPHWTVRLGPLVHLVRRWSGDQNSLLILEDGLDADIVLLPFKPIAMNVLQCSFISGIQMRKVLPLLKALQPKIVVFPEDLKQKIIDLKSSSHSFSVICYDENETLDVQSLKESAGVEIATDLATDFSWRKLKQGNLDVTRLKGQLLITGNKHLLHSGNHALESSQSHSKPLLQWGSLDIEKLHAQLSKMGINGFIEQGMSDAESQSVGIIQVHDPNKALIEVGATKTVISTCDDNLSSLIFQAVSTLVNAI